MSSQTTMKQQQSQAYWSSLSPIKVISAKVVDSNLVLQIQNTGTGIIRLDGINVGGTDLPIYPYYAGDAYGPAYCSRPNDNFSATMTCSLMLGAGETAYVAAQGAISGARVIIDCAGKTSTEISEVKFTYSPGSSSITNILLKGDKPIIASCGTKECDTNWVKVPGNSTMLINDFCLMKYEARNVGGKAISQTGNSLWNIINQSDAMAACAALGSGYHLIRDREWVAAATNIANVATNWNTSVVGAGSLKKGNVAENSSVAYDSLIDPDTGISNSTAELFLSTGESVWHLSGNVWEWTDGSVFENRTDPSACNQGSTPYCYNDPAGTTGGLMPINGTPVLANSLVEYTEISNFNSLNYSKVSWTSNQGAGKVYLNPGLAFGWNGASNSYYSPIHGFLRGGTWTSPTFDGIFALHLRYAPTYTDDSMGFRCAR